MNSILIVVVGAFVFADMLVLSGGIASAIVLAALTLGWDESSEVQEVKP